MTTKYMLCSAVHPAEPYQGDDLSDAMEECERRFAATPELNDPEVRQWSLHVCLATEEGRLGSRLATKWERYLDWIIWHDRQNTGDIKVSGVDL